MKKIFFAAISLLTILLSTSCSNDDITIEKVGRRYTLALNVNTQGIYDQFGWANDVREEYLRDGSRAIGVQTYLYDINGDLVQSDLTVLPTYNAANVKFEKLVEGNYTIIVVETLVNPDIDNTSSDWTFEGVDKLSTAKVKTDGTLGWASILGVTSTTVSLSSNTELNLEPEAIGAKVNYYCYNVGNASYNDKNGTEKLVVNMGLATVDVSEYYHLNPQLSLNDRLSGNLTDSDHTIVRAQMSAEKFEEGYYSSFYIVEREVTWRFCWQFDGDNLWTNFENTNISSTIENGKTYYAGFYYLDKNNFPRTYFGDQAGLSSWKTSCDNILSGLTPSSQSLYAAPYTNWSVGTVSAVKSYMSGFTLVEDVTLQDDGKYELTYGDANNYNTIYWYDFTTATSGLTDAYVALSKDYFKLDQVKSELTSTGFTVRTEGDGYTIYANAAGTTAVYLSDLTSYVLVNYYDPAAYTSSAARRAISEKKMKDIPVLNVTGSQKLLTPFKNSSRATMEANPNAIMRILK